MKNIAGTGCWFTNYSSRSFTGLPLETIHLANQCQRLKYLRSRTVKCLRSNEEKKKMGFTSSGGFSDSGLLSRLKIILQPGERRQWAIPYSPVHFYEEETL
uniref:Uncharacterized protein n=1 Tax=Salix viminalis TaxID=40686 RepID=A0A6N2MM68_SALVM